MQAISGGRDNSVAFAKIPAAGLRATPTVGEMQVALGANVGLGFGQTVSRTSIFSLKGKTGRRPLTATMPCESATLRKSPRTVVTQVTVGGGGA